jgi:quercetin dioxygenase-like cupin family protein
MSTATLDEVVAAPSRGYIVEPGTGHNEGVLNIVWDRVYVKLDAATTDGAFGVLECLTEPLAGPPLHRHLYEDESFFVLEGRIRFEIDGREFIGEPGSFAFVPRGAKHRFQNISEKTSRMLVMVTPGGLEEFFRELSAVMDPAAPPDPEIAGPIAEKHGVEILGPTFTEQG